MHTKYVFLDIDGTLVDKGGKIPDSARLAIERARSNGHKIFVCSGRARCEMHDYILEVGIDGIVGSAGAYVEMDGKMIYHRPMTEDMNRILLDYFESRGMCIFIETNEDLIVNDTGLCYVDNYIKECEANDEPYDKAFFDLSVPLADIKEPEKLAINKLLYVTTKYDPEDIKKDLQDAFTVVDSAIALPGNSGELSEPGMHKGRGIDVVVKHLGIDIADTIGIGDGENDIEMLRAAGVAIAMGNGKQALKDIADYITTDIDKDGIWNAFLHYGLIEKE